MRISVSMILDRLPYSTKYVPSADAGVDAIVGVRLLDKTAQHVKSDILYITEYSYLKDVPKGMIPLNLFVINDVNEKYNDKKTVNNNVVLLNSDVSHSILLEMIQDIIVFFNNIPAKMIEILSDNRGLQYLIDNIYKIIGNPISISNLNFKILAYTQFKETKSSVWEKHYKSTTINGYISNEHNKFKHIKTMVDRMRKTDKPVFFNVEDENAKPFICINMKQKNQSIGFFTVFETEKPFTKGTFDLIEYFSKILSIELQKNEVTSASEEVKYGYLIEDLLNGKQMPDEEIKKILKYFSFTVSNLYFVMVLKTAEDEIDKSELSYLRIKLMDIIKCNTCIIYKNSIIAIGVAPIQKQLNENNIPEFKEYLINAKLFAGISSEFTELSMVKKAYDEAVNAVDLGVKLEQDSLYFHYLDVQFYHLLDLCSKQTDVENLCHPALRKLIEYDKNKKTDMINTLYCYIRNSKSKAHTAAELHLQRSSLHYRINKIEDIMGMDLNDYNTYFHIELSLEILKYLKKIKL